MSPLLFEPSEFLIATCKKKKLTVCVSGCPDVRLILVLVWKNCLGFIVGYQRAPGTSEKKRTPGTSERFIANCGVGPSTRGQGDSASLAKPTQDQRRLHKAVVCLVGPASKVKADCCCAVLPQCTCLLLMQLQKRVLPALFHLRCPSQSHQRSARGRTRLTTVISISCRSL